MKTLAALLVSMHASIALAQTAAPGASAPPAPRAAGQQVPAPIVGTATVRGLVTTSDGKPLRRARVTLTFDAPTSSGGRQPPPAVSTNTQGLFTIKEVPAGIYRLSVTRAGYLTVQYGQRRVQEAGRAIEVRDGQALERLDVAMPRAAVIAGVITDEVGEPYPGVRVEVLERRYFEGRLAPFPAGTSTTDDLGAFRIANLPPGSFYLMASSKESLRGGRDGKEILSYGFTYFPGVAPDKAEAIAVSAGQTRTDLNFRLIPNKTARVRGRAESPEGVPLEGRQVSITFEYRDSGAYANPPLASTRTGRDGTFELRDIPPGTYRVLGAGSASIDVNGDDIDNLVIVPRVGSTIAGKVETDEGAAPPFAPAGLRVLLEQGKGEVLGTVRVQNINPDWSFKLTSVGGPFRFRFSGLRDDWMLKSVMLGDKDITDSDWNVPTGDKQLDGLTLVMTRKIGRIGGDVVGGDGKPTSGATIVLFAEDPDLWGPGTRHIRTTRPDDNGRFSIGTLPPGIYRLVARDYVQNGQWLNPQYLESLRAGSTRVEILEGGSATATLRLP